MGYDRTSFRYSYVDLAGQKDPTPAEYVIYWPGLLSASGLELSGIMSNNIVKLNWISFTEQNSSHFIIERSWEDLQFELLNNTIPAAGVSTVRKNYQALNDINDQNNHPAIYYRIKLVDLNSNVKYSTIIKLRLAKEEKIATWPSPFRNTVNLNITSEVERIIQLQLRDISGKALVTQTEKLIKGDNILILKNLEYLPSGFYMLQINNPVTGEKTYQKLQKLN